MVPSFCWLVLGVSLASSPGSIAGRSVSGGLAQLLLPWLPHLCGRGLTHCCAQRRKAVGGLRHLASRCACFILSAFFSCSNLEKNVSYTWDREAAVL